MSPLCSGIGVSPLRPICDRFRLFYRHFGIGGDAENLRHWNRFRLLLMNVFAFLYQFGILCCCSDLPSTLPISLLTHSTASLAGSKTCYSSSFERSLAFPHPSVSACCLSSIAVRNFETKLPFPSSAATAIRFLAFLGPVCGRARNPP